MSLLLYSAKSLKAQCLVGINIRSMRSAPLRDRVRTTLVSTNNNVGRISRYSSKFQVSHILKRPVHYGFAGPAAVCLIGSLWETQSSSRSSCELALKTRNQIPIINKDHGDLQSNSTSRWTEIRRKAVKALRLFARAVKLMVALSPIAAFYPIQRLIGRKKQNKDAQDIVLEAFEEGQSSPLGWYLKLCLWSVEWSGAAVIKLMQWAGSRPDLFGNEFCSVFSRLQDHTTPHSMRHTENVLRQAYGNDWTKRLQLEKLVGSGCIGQVYKGIAIKDDGTEQKIAVKVRHPNVTDAIDDDLDLLRLLVRLMGKIPYDVFKEMKWLNPEGAIEEFAELLKLQLDFRTEAEHLELFNKNFRNDPNVLFPKLVGGFETHPEVLVETFCDGQPFHEFLSDHKDKKELLSEMCNIGIRAVCKMLFVDNFMHGDLHPGNVFISAKDKKFILLDVGIVAAYTDEDHDVIVNVLTSFIRSEGRKAGRYMIADSDKRLKASGEASIDEEGFIDKIEAMVKKAKGEDYLMEHLGTYLSYICEAASKHHVMMNQSFVSSALTVKVLEGIALALDPSIEIWRVANPIILESEMKRNWSKASKQFVEYVSRTDLARITGLDKHLEKIR